MLGPIFLRELATVPRRPGHFAARAAGQKNRLSDRMWFIPSAPPRR